MESSVLVEAVNNLMMTGEIKSDQIKELFQISCRALRHLSEDEEFKQALNESQSALDNRDIAEILENIENFNDFLQIEKDLLIKAGVTENAAEALIQAGRELSNQIKDFKSDPDKILISINKVRNQTCEVAQLLNIELEDRERAKTRERILKAAGMVLGGAVVFTINAVSTPILGSIGVVVSQKIGEVLITIGAEAILE